MAVRDITARLRVDGGARFRGDLREDSRAVDDLNRATSRSGATARRASKDWDKHSLSLSSFGRVAGNVAKVGAGTAAITTLGGSAVVALGGVVGLSGALAALPAAALGGATALGTLKLAFGGLGGAINALGDPSTTATQMAAALKGLTPQAIAFAREVAGAKSQLGVLRGDAQKALFPGLSAGLRAALPAVLPIARSAVTGVGGALGTAGRIAGQTLATPGVRRDLSTFVAGNTRAFQILTAGVAPATRALSTLLTVLGPIEQDLARAAVHGAKMLDTFTSSHTSEIRSFLEHGMHDAHELAIGLGNVATAVVHVFNASKSPDGRDLFDGFARLTRSLSDWTGSAQGQREMVKFFGSVRTILQTAGPMVGTFATDLLMIGTTLTNTFAHLPKPVQELLLGGVALGYGANKLGLTGSSGGSGRGGGVVSSLVSGLVPGSGQLGTAKNPAYVIVVGGSSGGGNNSNTGDRSVGSVVSHLLGSGVNLLGRALGPGTKLGALLGIGGTGAEGAGALGGMRMLTKVGFPILASRDSISQQTDWDRLLNANTSWAYGAGYTLNAKGHWSQSPSVAGISTHRTDVTDLGFANPGHFRSTHRTDITALGRANPIVPLSQSLYGALLPALAPRGSVTGASVAGDSAAKSIGNMLAAGMLPDLEDRIVKAIAKGLADNPARVYLDGQQLTDNHVQHMDRTAANR